MKTTLPASIQQPDLIIKTVSILLALLLKFSSTVIRCSYWVCCVIILFSCQQNLTHPETSGNTGINNEATNTHKPAERFIVIDTLTYSFANLLSFSQTPPNTNQKIQHKVKRFYYVNSLTTKWLEENNPNAIYYELIAQLKNAANYGLHAADYDVDGIEERMYLLYRAQHTDLKAIVTLDIHITETFFLFATHLKNGKITDSGYSKNLWVREIKHDNNADVALLAKVKNVQQLKDAVYKLQPANAQYAKLQTALRFYRSLETTDMELTTRISKKISPGERSLSIPFVRSKLALIDGLYAIAKDSLTGNIDSLQYDDKLVAAVKLFQQQHGLETTGIISEKTTYFLNQSFKEKADLIALNMERMRWLPENYSDQYILVNIPEYKLRIYEKQKQTFEMKVIVGAINSATPIFHDTLEHVVFSPTWTVPPSIIKGEILPRLKKNAAYYSQRDFSFFKNGVEIDPALERWDSALNVAHYRVVQKPGRTNSLGLVKFAMPNTMNIYLHDTPDHKPFSENYRALSHGCIRLDDPARFAAYLLQDEKHWDLQAISKAMKVNKPTPVVLKKQYSVHLEYNTVWIDDKGEINFREDIYGHDKRQLEKMRPIKKIVIC